MGKVAKVILYSVPIIALILASLFVVERYVISLTGYALGAAGLCKHKSVHAGGDNGHPQKLSFAPDIQMIADQMEKKAGYRVRHKAGYRVLVSRKVGDVEYSVSLVKDTVNGTSYGTFDTSTQAIFAMETFDYSTRQGEQCRTPNSILDGNVYAIIDDLPLSNEEKTELKGHVHSGVILDINLPLP